MTCPSMQYSTDYKVWSCLQQTPLPTSLLSNQQLRLVPPKPTASLCLICNQIFHHRHPVLTIWQTVLGDLHSVLSLPFTCIEWFLGCGNTPFVLKVLEKNQNLPIPRCPPSKDPEMCENVLNSTLCPRVWPFYALVGLSTKLQFS